MGLWLHDLLDSWAPGGNGKPRWHSHLELSMGLEVAATKVDVQNVKIQIKMNQPPITSWGRKQRKHLVRKILGSFWSELLLRELCTSFSVGFHLWCRLTSNKFEEMQISMQLNFTPTNRNVSGPQSASSHLKLQTRPFGGTLGGSERYLPVSKMSQATNKIQSQFSTP